MRRWLEDYWLAPVPAVRGWLVLRTFMLLFAFDAIADHLRPQRADGASERDVEPVDGGAQSSGFAQVRRQHGTRSPCVGLFGLQRCATAQQRGDEQPASRAVVHRLERALRRAEQFEQVGRANIA